MNSKSLPATLAALAILTACHRPSTIAQLPGTPNWKPDQDHAQVLRAEETHGNGIEVGPPKVYDDASLRMMLASIGSKLNGLTGLNQTALTNSLGAVSGATISQTQVGVQVSGPAVPGAAAPTPPTVPAGLAFTPPSSVSPSSLDMLNQQMQLSYELASLQLLLEGALSDRFVAGQSFVKPRVTLGFQVSLRPPAAFRDAVAVVEVEIEPPTQTLSVEAPSITALLPREKTYNVAALTDHTTSIGAGAVVGAVGAAGSFMHAHKTLYLVQDQDTVALQRPPNPNHPQAVSFLWEFHPVLGQHFVRSGLKQTFVQLAVPILPETPCFGTAKIRTYWRRFDQKTGTTGAVIAESVLVSATSFLLPQFDLTPAVGNPSLEDLGDGTVLVSVPGSYLSGTYVQIGPTRYVAGTNLTVEDAGLKFVAPIASLARWTAHLVARSGAPADLLMTQAQKPLPAATAACQPPTPAPPVPTPASLTLKITSAVPVPLNETDSAVRVETSTELSAQFDGELLLAIGGKVFGLKDAPIKRERTANGPVITAVVPTALLIANPTVRVFRPFWSDMDGNGKHLFDDSYNLPGFALDSATERLVLVSVDAKGDAVYLLYGNNLENAKILIPESGATLGQFDRIAQGRIRLLTMTKSALQATRKIVLLKAEGQGPLVLDVPDPKTTPTAPTPPKATIDSPVVQNTDELDVTVEHAADVVSVTLGKKPLQWKALDDSTIRLLNLKADAVTTEQKSREITVQNKKGAKVNVKFDVVLARIGAK